jgi:hypothetical protein
MISSLESLNSARRPRGLWICGQRCPQAPQAQQQQKKRTFDVLQNADIFTRYGQGQNGRNGCRVQLRRKEPYVLQAHPLH